jgi:sugar-specific transcriptional regulator TrmB
MNWNSKAINLLGMSAVETAIMTSLATPKTVQEIAQATKLSRTGINYALQNLTDRQLIQVVPKGKRKLYSAISREDLQQLLDQATSELEREGEVGAKGGAAVKRKKGRFAIHVGKEEVIAAYKRIAYGNKNTRIRAIQHHRPWLELMDKITPRQLVAFNDTIKKNDLIIDGMLNASAYKAYQEEIRQDASKHLPVAKSLEGRMADYTVFRDDIFNYDTEVWLYKDTTVLINWKEEVAIEFTNASMTGFMRDLFAFAKAANQRINHHRALEAALKREIAASRAGS